MQCIAALDRIYNHLRVWSPATVDKTVTSLMNWSLPTDRCFHGNENLGILLQN